MNAFKKTSLQLSLALLITTALICISAAFVSYASLSSGIVWSKLIASGFITGFYLVLALCSLLPAHKKGLVAFSVAGLLVTAGTYLFILYYVWYTGGTSMGSYFSWLSNRWRWALLASFFSLSFAQAGVLLRLGIQHPAIRTTRNVALLAIAALVVITLISMLSEASHGVLLVRITYFLIAISLFFTAITLVAHELSKATSPQSNKSPLPPNGQSSIN